MKQKYQSYTSAEYSWVWACSRLANLSNDTPLRKTDFPFVDNLLVRNGTPCPLFECWDPIWLNLCRSCAWTTVCESVRASVLLSGEHCSDSSITWISQSFCLLFPMDPSSSRGGGEGFDGDILFRTGCSQVSHSQHIV